MKLKALHRIEGKRVIRPGEEFEISKEAGERLVTLGAAALIATEEAGGNTPHPPSQGEETRPREGTKKAGK